MRTLPVLLFAISLSGCLSKPNKELKVQAKDTVVFISKGNKPAIKIDTSLVVLDTLTNLYWTKQDFSYIKKRFLKTWKETSEWCDELNAMHYAGISNWTVPSISQYRTIDKTKQDRINYRRKFLELDTTCVWGKGPYSFWSSTTPNENTVSYISFIDGFATSGNRVKKFANPYSSWKGVELGMSVRLVASAKQAVVEN